MDCGNIRDIAQDGLSADCKYDRMCCALPGQLKIELNLSGLVQPQLFCLVWEEGIAVCHSLVVVAAWGR